MQLHVNCSVAYLFWYVFTHVLDWIRNLTIMYHIILTGHGTRLVLSDVNQTANNTSSTEKLIFIQMCSQNLSGPSLIWEAPSFPFCTALQSKSKRKKNHCKNNWSSVFFLRILTLIQELKTEEQVEYIVSSLVNTLLWDYSECNKSHYTFGQHNKMANTHYTL